MTPREAARIRKAIHEPRLLFRAASERSRGGRIGNSPILIDPLYPTEKYPYVQDGTYYPSFDSMPWERAAVMLNSHLQWQYSRPSGFSSWSTSLLDALMHGVRRRDEKQGNVMIYLLDTSLLKGEGRMFSAVRLIKALPNQKKLAEKLRRQAVGEHLIYGRLTPEDGMYAVRLETLIDAGLFIPLRRLDITAHCKEQNVNHVHRNMKIDRSTLFHPRHKRGEPKVLHNGAEVDSQGVERFPFKAEYMPTLRALGRCFGPTWEAVMTIAFACTRRRYVNIESDHFDLTPLLEDLDGLPFPELAGCEVPETVDDLDVPDEELREDHVQMLRVWRLLEEYQYEGLRLPE